MSPAADARGHALTSRYRRYVLVAMTTVYTANLFDRGVLFLLLQPIKEDLRLSDTQIGLVTGIAFGVFYATLGIPIARWADRGNRVTITSIAIGLWGLTAMLCAFVTSFVQLLLARMAAGVGDAGTQPPLYSLLGDYFPEPAERVQAMYSWTLATPLAGLISFMAAGWLNEHYGWRQTFFMMGLLGLVLAIVVRLTFVEPRVRADAKLQSPKSLPPFSAVWAILWRQPACRHLTLSMILLFTVGQGVVTWQAAYMMRQHGTTTAELGVWMGLISGLGGLASLLLGKYVVGRWFASDERGQMRLAGFSVASSTPICVAFLIAPSKELAFLALLLQTAVFIAFSAPISALLQRLVPNEMRATVLTVQLFLANLIGMGVGPLLVGSLSDLLRPTFGEDALRHAMLLVSGVWLWAGYHLLRAGHTVKDDLSGSPA
jgi:MFS family permease